jgi:predicted trehalose synthase
MRTVFAAIERAQKEFLRALGVSPVDPRLRRFRDVALALFERSWVAAMRRGMETGDDSAAAIYILCLARALSMKEVPDASLPGNGELKKLVDEVLQ